METFPLNRRFRNSLREQKDCKLASLVVSKSTSQGVGKFSQTAFAGATIGATVALGVAFTLVFIGRLGVVGFLGVVEVVGSNPAGPIRNKPLFSLRIQGFFRVLIARRRRLGIVPK